MVRVGVGEAAPPPPPPSEPFQPSAEDWSISGRRWTSSSKLGLGSALASSGGVKNFAKVSHLVGADGLGLGLG